jgi:hypothetical protein
MVLFTLLLGLCTVWLQAVLPSFRRYIFQSNISTGQNELPKRQKHCHNPFSWREHAPPKRGQNAYIHALQNNEKRNQHVEQINAFSVAAGELWYTEGRHVIDTILLANTVIFPYITDYYLAVRAVGRPAFEDKRKTSTANELYSAVVYRICSREEPHGSLYKDYFRL